MTTITDKINQTIKDCMKSKEEFRLGVVRMIKAELLNNDKSDKKAPELDIVQGYHKKLSKSLEMYQGKQDQIDRIQKEMKIVEEFLPRALNRQELEARVQKHLGLGNMGAIMKTLKAEIEGEGLMFEGRLASEIIKSKLG